MNRFIGHFLINVDVHFSARVLSLDLKYNFHDSTDLSH